MHVIEYNTIRGHDILNCQGSYVRSNSIQKTRPNYITTITSFS